MNDEIIRIMLERFIQANLMRLLSLLIWNNQTTRLVYWLRLAWNATKIALQRSTRPKQIPLEFAYFGHDTGLTWQAATMYLIEPERKERKSADKISLISTL